MKHLTRALALVQASQEPTLFSIPGILLRTIMRTFARLALVLAALAFAIGVAFLGLSLFFATWPSVHRRR